MPEIMLKCYLNKPVEYCNDFNALDIDWEFVFKHPKFTAKARERRRKRGTNKFPKIYRFVRILSDIDIETLRKCPDVDWAEVEYNDEPLYNPTDPQGLDYSWTKQTLTHATNTTAFDVEKGDGIIVGIIESAGNGANYTDAELGGTGNKANDWAAIQTGTHAKFANYTTPLGVSVDPYGTGHGNGTCRQAVSVIDNAIAYCGSCPNAKVIMAVGQDFDQAIQRMADLGVDVISVSYTNAYGHRTAIQYVTAAGVIVVYAHGSNSHVELPVVPFEAILVGQFSLTDTSQLSYGVGLTVISRAPIGSGESYSTPAVAGICGLILAKNPTWNIYDVWSALIQVCQKPAGMGGQLWHKEYGWGIPDAYTSLQLTQVQLRPLPVFNVTIATAGLGIQLTWNNLPTTNFHHFEVCRKLNSMPLNETDGTLVYSGTEESYYDKLALSGNWYYGIWGVDSNGNYSPYAAVTDFYTKKNISYIAPIPIILDVSATFNTITLSWQGISNALGYKVYWDVDSGVPYASSQDVGDVTEYVIHDLLPGQQYYLVVTAYDDESNETNFSIEEQIITDSFPTPIAPIILSTTSTETTITVTWSIVEYATGYKVYWDVDSGEPYEYSIDVGNVLTFVIANLEDNQQYYVAVQAYHNEIVSEKSVEVAIKTLKPEIAVLTEIEAKAAEYSYEILLKIQEILKSNGDILKAGFYTVGKNVFIGSHRSLPSLPALHIESARHTEKPLTFGKRENTITFTVFIRFYTMWADTEENEIFIHQLGDRLLEVFRQNDELDNLAREILSMNIDYDANVNTTLLRTGLLTLEVIKDVSC